MEGKLMEDSIKIEYIETTISTDINRTGDLKHFSREQESKKKKMNSLVLF